MTEPENSTFRRSRKWSRITGKMKTTIDVLQTINNRAEIAHVTDQQLNF